MDEYNLIQDRAWRFSVMDKLMDIRVTIDGSFLNN
jgi:hypothetical protein